MVEGLLYLVSSFWIGAVHAATPGHAKTVSAAYLVGTRGRPSDALALGVLVTLAHTSGIIVFAGIAAVGSTVLSQRSEVYLSLATSLLMIGVGASMLGSYVRRPAHAHAHPAMSGSIHRHGWGLPHSHHLGVEKQDTGRPSWGMLLGLGVAGGLLPDPAALAVLLAALASGKVVLGLLTVLVFSLGFASVLVVVAALAGRLGSLALDRMSGQLVERLQMATAALIVVIGATMSVAAWRQLADLR